MDWDAILAEAKSAVSTLTGLALTQGSQYIAAFSQALPAIKAGIASAEPFVVSGFKLLTNQSTGVPSDQWDTQLQLMQAQLATVDAQVAQDALDQP